MRQSRVERWRKIAAIVPLIFVICSALIWSGFATFQHAQGPLLANGQPRVPGEIAWTLIAALDGSVIVTTPVWLSTVLPPPVRWYAGAICCAALGGSMLINWAETGWPGVFPPLIAGLLIHLVGVVLRAFARLELVSAEEFVAVPVEELPVEAVPEEVLEDVGQQIHPVVSIVQKIPDRLPSATSARQFALSLLDKEELSGKDLTAAIRKAGFSVGDSYGRTILHEWRKTRKQVSA